MTASPLMAALAVIILLAFVNRPRLTVLFGLVIGFTFLVVRRLRRRQGVRGAVREQIAQLRDDNSIVQRSIWGDLERAIDLLIDQYIIDQFLQESNDVRVTTRTRERDSNKNNWIWILTIQSSHFIIEEMFLKRSSIVDASNMQNEKC